MPNIAYQLWFALFLPPACAKPGVRTGLACAKPQHATPSDGRAASARVSTARLDWNHRASKSSTACTHHRYGPHALTARPARAVGKRNVSTWEGCQGVSRGGLEPEKLDRALDSS